MSACSERRYATTRVWSSFDTSTFANAIFTRSEPIAGSVGRAVKWGATVARFAAASAPATTAAIPSRRAKASRPSASSRIAYCTRKNVPSSKNHDSRSR
jgi:hypothetical protein